MPPVCSRPARGVRIFQRRIDFEYAADRPVVHELLGVLQRRIEAALEREHQRVGMSLVQLGGEFTIRFE